MPISLNDPSIGQDQDAVAVYDKAAGTYKNPVEGIPQDDLLPSNQMPKAPDPSPFVVGPMVSGGR